MEDDITYTSKASRNSIQAKPVKIIPGLKKQSKPSGASIPNSFLRKVHFMEKYPQNLRDYIRKCFAQCTDENSRDIVSSKLMDTINSVSENGNINQHNWNAHPLVTPVEKEPTPPPPPPPPPTPPAESFNHPPNRPVQAFSSTFMTQQPPPQMMQQSYNFPPTLQPPFGNYQYGQPPPPPQPNSIMQPPQIPSMMQPNFQNNNNFQYNNEQNNYNRPYQVKNQQFFQNQGRISNQNSFQNYEYKPQGNINNNNNNNEYQYPNNQYQPQNTTFNSNYSNPYEYNQQKRQDLASFAPGQTIPKPFQNQKPPPPPLMSQFVTSQTIKPNKNPNNPNLLQSNVTNNPNASNQPLVGKGKKKKKNKKNKFNQQQNQFLSNDNNDEFNSTSAPSISSSRQRISFLQDENVRVKSIVGTSDKLEKEYLRLAGDIEIDPSMVRPLPVLKDSLQFCLEKYHQNNNYEYISEQLRSIRQDLSVQHIEDPFNVEVYETHGKLAILNRDWGNFNQSMGQLEILYPKNLGSFKNICEFWKYRIIYLVGIDDTDGLCSFIPKIDSNVLESKDVQFALKIWKIAQSEEWMRYFSIMKKSDELVAGVMSLKAQSLRITALSCTCRAVRKLTLADYRTFLCFEENEDDQLRQFLSECEIEIPEK